MVAYCAGKAVFPLENTLGASRCVSKKTSSFLCPQFQVVSVGFVCTGHGFFSMKSPSAGCCKTLLLSSVLLFHSDKMLALGK